MITVILFSVYSTINISFNRIRLEFLQSATEWAHINAFSCYMQMLTCRNQTTFAFSIGDHYNVSFISCRELLIPQAPTNFFQTLHPSISAWTTHELPMITSPSKMITVLICRNAPTDSCRNLTALIPSCTKTSFLITPHYICAHRNSETCIMLLFKGYSLVRTSTLLWCYICTHKHVFSD